MKDTKEKIKKKQKAKKNPIKQEDQAKKIKDDKKGTIESEDSIEDGGTIEHIEDSSEPTLEEQLGEAKDKYLRLYSEFENFRRRTSKDKLELINTANKNLMADLVPVLDDFARAMVATEESEDAQSLKEGMTLIQNKLNKILENKGLKNMEVKTGDDFNDEKHEAITQIPAKKELEGRVVDVVEPGYTLSESVVRFAKVVVGVRK